MVESSIILNYNTKTETRVFFQSFSLFGEIGADKL